jgi:hypothetical protein
MDAEVASDLGHGAAFVDQTECIELELTCVSLAGGDGDFLQGTRYVPVPRVHETDSIPDLLGFQERISPQSARTFHSLLQDGGPL